MLSTFSCTCWPSVWLFRSFAHLKIGLFIYFLLLSCMSSLYILDIYLISDTRFANIFLLLVGCLFTLLMVSFAVQKLEFQFDLVLLVYFCFCCHCFWFQMKKNYSRPLSRSWPPMFSFRSFMVSGLMFRSLIHLIFVYV